MARCRTRRITYELVAAATALGTTVAAAGSSFAATSATSSSAKLVTNPASLVNPFIGTSGAVNTFPGPDLPFGMIQWSPDTTSRPDGGGYEYNHSKLIGYSLTHLSGPGCRAYGDVPILPTVGAIGTSPTGTTDSFSHATETAQAGYYADTLGNGVTVKLTDTTRAGLGSFSFPATSRANLLLKLSDSADQVDGTSARVVGDDEVTGSVTAGHFCGQSSPPENDYTLHFEIVFNQPFTASGTWGGALSSSSVTRNSKQVTQNNVKRATAAAPKATTPSTKVFAGSRADLTVRPRPGPTVHGTKAAAAPQTTVTNPDGLYLTFNTTKNRTVMAKVGISFTSTANAALNLGAEIPAWNFNQVETANQAAWDQLLGKVQIAGGDQAQQVEFYTALYHALLHPNVFSDENGQYMGYDGKVHTAAPGHAEYANYSGWDIYRDQVQLAAMVAPQQTSDSVTSMLNDYEQTGMLPKWNLGGGESYVMVGDPADSIIADAYAFGARDFNVPETLTAMITEATTTNDIRPGNATLLQDGYLPYDGRYGCCNFYGPVSTQLEYDTADYAIASLANDTGDTAAYTEFATLAQSWQNTLQRRDRLHAGQAVQRPVARRLHPGHLGRLRGRHVGAVHPHGALQPPGADPRPGRQRGLGQLPEQPDRQPDQPERHQRRPVQRTQPGDPLRVRLRGHAVPDAANRPEDRGQAVLRRPGRAGRQRRPRRDELRLRMGRARLLPGDPGHADPGPGQPGVPGGGRAPGQREDPHDQRAGRPGFGALHPEDDRQRHGVEQGLPGLRHAVVGRHAGLHPVQHAQHLMGQQRQRRAALGPDR